MEEAGQLHDYLPVSLKTSEESEYVTFLWTSFQTNYMEGKFQFAFLAYHMLTMSLVYFKVWQIKRAWPKDFQKCLIGFDKDIERKLLDATSPFTFSTVRERRVFRFLKLIGCDNNKIGTYQRLVKDRNEMAHANGHIHVKTEDMLEDKIKNILKVADDIQIQSKAVVQYCYRDFLHQSSDTDEPEYMTDSDQIREILIYPNYMSKKDITFCCNFTLSEVDISKRPERVNRLHNSLIEDYGSEE